jgi:hypothetical protein
MLWRIAQQLVTSDRDREAVFGTFARSTPQFPRCRLVIRQVNGPGNPGPWCCPFTEPICSTVLLSISVPSDNVLWTSREQRTNLGVSGMLKLSHPGQSI